MAACLRCACCLFTRLGKAAQSRAGRWDEGSPNRFMFRRLSKLQILCTIYPLQPGSFGSCCQPVRTICELQPQSTLVVSLEPSSQRKCYRPTCQSIPPTTSCSLWRRENTKLGHMVFRAFNGHSALWHHFQNAMSSWTMSTWESAHKYPASLLHRYRIDV